MPIAFLNNDLLVSGTHNFVFLAKPEKVAFIIRLEFSIGKHAYQAVIKACFFGDQ